MSCTTILVGKKATYDGSTMIARNDDGNFEVKKLIVVTPDKKKSKYKSVIGHLEIELPKDPMRYTATPSVSLERGIWAANGINEANVGMSATETLTTNPRVLGADPYVVYQERKGNRKEVPGGIGEEDMVELVLPYVKSAREGVLRLGSLLEKYGTYEPNGIAFNDENEAWWLETIGGHHWIAKRVKDNEYVMMPNQFGIDSFDLDDAYGQKKEHLCSKDLKKFISDNFLNLNKGKVFNPRYIFGTHNDADHVYNTPRAWYIGRYFNPHTYKWEGPDADFTPESDDIPWSMVPEKKITVEDIKYILSSHFQGTPYDPLGRIDDPRKKIYRPIGVAKTIVMAVLQIRPYMPEQLKGIEWICFGPNPYNTVCPLYTWTNSMPKYFSNVGMDVSTDNLYWNSRLLGALADGKFNTCSQIIERYQLTVASRGHEIIGRYDREMLKSKNYSLIEKANEELAAMAREETAKTLNMIVDAVSRHMNIFFNREDK